MDHKHVSTIINVVVIIVVSSIIILLLITTEEDHRFLRCKQVFPIVYLALSFSPLVPTRK